MIPDRFSVILHWIREREAIRLRKEAGIPRPWTSDPILAEWRFCNVDRNDDTVTRWIFKEIIGRHRDDPALWFNLVIARLVNWPDTLAKLGWFREWDPERFVSVIEGIRGKAWTGAYMIPAGPPGVGKARYLADATLSFLWNAKPGSPTSGHCESWFDFIERAPSMGGFLANQVVTDLKYAPVLASAPDWHTFVVAGPGTQRGLSRLFGLPLKKSWRREEAQAALLDVRGRFLQELSDMSRTFWDLNNVSNCFCEFDKYLRVRDGEGKPRSRYVPAFPPAGWLPHPEAAGWWHNYKEVLTEAQLRARMGV